MQWFYLVLVLNYHASAPQYPVAVTVMPRTYSSDMCHSAGKDFVGADPLKRQYHCVRSN